MAEDIKTEFRAAVKALSLWVASAPIPHSRREWREQYLELDAEVRRLSMKLDTVRDDRLNGAAKTKTQPKRLGRAVADQKLTRVLIVLLSAALLLAADDSSAKTSTPPSFGQTPLGTSAKGHFRVVSVVNDRKDNPYQAQATGFFAAPGRGLTSRLTFENANRGALRLSSGNHVPIVGIVAEDKRLGRAMIFADTNENDGPSLKLTLLDPREGDPVFVVGTESQPTHAASRWRISTVHDIPEIDTILHVSEGIPPEFRECPLLHSRGHVVTMEISKDIRGCGFGLAVPASELRLLMADLPQKPRPWSTQHRDQSESDGRSDGMEILTLNTSSYEQALAYLMAAKADLADPDIWLLEGERYEDFRLLEDTVEVYRNALRAKPDCALAHHRLGLAYGRLGRPNDAASEFEKALRINPVQAGTHYNLGVAYEEMGMLQEAVDAYQKALGVSPGAEQTYYNLGVTYCKLGRWRNAVQAFEETIRIAPGFADAHYNLGLAYLVFCQTSQALEQQRDLSSLDKERADKLLRFIKKLECAAAGNRVIPRTAAANRHAH